MKRHQLLFSAILPTMKCNFCIVLLSVLSLTSFAQRVKNTLTASVSGADRITMVRSSIDVPEWHEKLFWPLYEKYMYKVEEISSSTYRSIHDLTRVDRFSNEEDALNHATNLIAFRYNELAVRKQYYAEVATGLNGVIALQFLQTETLLEIMESFNIYEQSPWKKFRFHPMLMPMEKLREAKHNTMTTALSLPADKAEVFWKLYSQYEEECDALLGEDYSMISLYAGEASDFTPALAKRLGYDLLNITQREIKLKEKYFHEMNGAVGSTLAARFLAWEDYYSLVSKMYAWSDMP
jgi:hypothetical protein